MVDVCFYLTHYAVSKTYKFFFLADKLRESGISVEIILCNTEMSGIRPEEATPELIRKFPGWNVRIKSKKKMANYIADKPYKYFVVGCYSGDISGILKVARSNGAKIIEIATIGFNDPIEHHADVNLLISKLAFKAAMHKRPGKAKKARNIHYVGSLFSDDIPNTYTSNIRSEDDFRAKYDTGNKRIFIWMPGRDDMQNLDFQKTIADKFPPNDCLLMTTHPWTEKYQQKFLSKAKRFIRHVDSNDVYWAFKSMTCGIARNSTSGIEIAVLKKPVIYIGKFTRRPYLASKVTPIGYMIKNTDQLNQAVQTFDFNLPDERYDRYLSAIYPTPYRPSWQRIRDFFVEAMCTKASQ